MNRKHLLYHIFEYMEACDMDITDMIESFNHSKTMFSDDPQPGEIAVASALYERHDAYIKAKKIV